MTPHPRARRATPFAALLAALLLPLAAPSAQVVTLARDAGDGTRTLASFDIDTGAPLARLQGVTLRAPQLAGRARLHALRDDLPNLRDAAGPAPRLRLPRGGSLYLLTRSDALGSEDLLVRVDGLGLPKVLLRGDLAGGPLLEWLAADDAGTRVLAATTTGRVWLVTPHERAAARELTPTVPVASIDGESLRLGPDTAWMLADGVLHRADLAAPAARFAPVADALGPGETLLPEFAVSADGRVVAVVSELPGGARRLHSAGPTGALEPVLADESDYDLPSLRDPAGPFLALSTDGSFVAWRETVLVKELFTRRVQTPAAPVQVTADGNFADTFDSGGILDFSSPDTLVFAWGESEPDDPETLLDGADILRMDLSDPNAPIENLSLTSGEPTEPFMNGGLLEIRDAALTPDGQRLLLELDPDDGDTSLRSLDLATGAPLVTEIPGTDQLFELLPAGPAVLAVSQPMGPFPAGLRLLPAGGPSQLVPLPPGLTQLDRFVTDPGGRLAAFVAGLGGGEQAPLLVNLVTAGLAPGGPRTSQVSEGLGFAHMERLVVGLGTPPRFVLLGGGLPPVELQLLPGDAVPLQP